MAQLQAQTTAADNGKRRDKPLEEAEAKLKTLRERAQYFEDQIVWLSERFPNGVYEDVTGLCKAATLAEIEEQDWSLNPGRYVGVVIEEDGLTEEEYINEMNERHASFISLNEKAESLKKIILENFQNLKN